ncbi:hypothetical protein Taro_040541 [Colocasia esculenta]|uniref:Uncharacterized protein n=1 Tax=Colocasia esculenta TaxID=4460 RepID=A0A843WM71_COLES|nr:hypothetical protein [Colocasia esculenta]
MLSPFYFISFGFGATHHNLILSFTCLVSFLQAKDFFVGRPVEEVEVNPQSRSRDLRVKKEAEDVDPQENEIELEDSDEDEHTSDQNESDNADANAKFDISPASEDEMENIWFEDDVQLLRVGGERYLISILTRPMTSAPLPLAVGSTASASPSQMASGSTPPSSDPVHADDETSHHEGEGNYNETMRIVWINEGYRNHRFTERSDESRARSAWTTTARANFKHLLYNVRRNAERVCASTDTNQWKEHGLVWMRKEYWVELCKIWRGEKWVGNSAQAKINRATHPEANVHTDGSVSFSTHKARMEKQLKQPPQFQDNDYISEKAREVAESYSRGMEERYRDDSQRPELDPDIWIAAFGAPKKGHVYGFGHSLGTDRMISSCSSSVSHATLFEFLFLWSTFNAQAMEEGFISEEMESDRRDLNQAREFSRRVVVKANHFTTFEA